MKKSALSPVYVLQADRAVTGPRYLAISGPTVRVYGCRSAREMTPNHGRQRFRGTILNELNDALTALFTDHSENPPLLVKDGMNHLLMSREIIRVL